MQEGATFNLDALKAQVQKAMLAAPRAVCKRRSRMSGAGHPTRRVMHVTRAGDSYRLGSLLLPENQPCPVRVLPLSAAPRAGVNSMIRKLALLATALVTAGACAGTSVQSTGGDIATTTPVTARRITAGTMIDVKTTTKIGSKQNNIGDTFVATVSDAVVAQNGQTVIPEGATVYGHITGLQNAPKTGDASVIRVDFDQIAINGQTYPLEAKVTLKVKSPSMSNETLKKAGIGAAAGVQHSARFSAAATSISCWSAAPLARQPAR